MLFLIIFIGIKFIGLHASTHDDSENYEDCSICEYIITSGKTSFLANDEIFVERVGQTFLDKFHVEYSYTYSKVFFRNSLFGRPPPSA